MTYSTQFVVPCIGTTTPSGHEIPVEDLLLDALKRCRCDDDVDTVEELLEISVSKGFCPVGVEEKIRRAIVMRRATM